MLSHCQGLKVVGSDDVKEKAQEVFGIMELFGILTTVVLYKSIHVKIDKTL